MALVGFRALVLQTFPYGDTSRILRIYSPTHGLRSVIAKGAQRPKSRFGGVLEPFTEGDAQVYLKEGRDLHTLGGFDLVRSRQALGRDLTAFAGASLIAELVLRSGTEEPQPELFGAVVETLDRIAAAGAREGGDAVLSGVWAIVALLGFRPELEGCVHCAREFAAAEPARFDIEAGGAACLGCRPTGRIVEAGVRDELARMTSGRAASIDPERRSVHRALLRAFLSAHLAHERPLRSLDLFMEQFR